MNHWIITKDHIEDGKSVGVKSCHYPKYLEPGALAVQFRLYDGDGNLYYEGRMEEHDFDPLSGYMSLMTTTRQRGNKAP